MSEDASWAEEVYDDQCLSWPDRCVHHDTWLEWHRDAADGNPPDIVEVATEQYNRKAPWYVREEIWGPVVEVLETEETVTSVREVPRGSGKTVANTLLKLYLGEYVLPYYPGLERENRRMNLISRSARHLADENMALVHQMIPYYSPWHKFPEGKLWDEPEAMIEKQIRRRKFNDRRIDFAIGTRLNAYGWDQSTRGSHPFVASIDDLLSDDNWQHADEQMKVILSGILPSVVQGGAVQIIGTPQAPDDVVERISESDAWDYMALPAFDEDGSLGYREKLEQDINDGYLDADVISQEEDWHCLSPEFLPYKELQRRQGSTKDDMNAWLREYQLKRIVSNLKLVDADAVLAARNHHRAYTRQVDSSHPNPVYAGLDPSRLKGSDIACVVLDVTEDGRRRVLQIEKVEEEEVDDELEIIHFINRINSLFHPFWLVEDNGYQGIIKPLSDKLMPGIRMENLAVTNLKHKEGGWKIIRTYYHAGALDFPFGPTEAEERQVENNAWPDGHDFAAQEKTKDAETQINSLMRRDGKIVGQKSIKDDIGSALFLALKASEDSGEVAAGTEVADINELLNQEESKPQQRSAEFGNQRDEPAYAQSPRVRDIEKGSKSRLGRALDLDTR